MSERKAIRPHYDVVLDFTPLQAAPEAAYVLVKQTFAIRESRCVPDNAVALQHDLRDPSLTPRIPAGSDFWIHKDASDVVVRGSAFAPNGRPVTEMSASVRVGSAEKRVRVFGDRTLEWQPNGRPVFPSPEPFIEMPLTYANAYGGIDPRMEMEPPASPEELLQFDLFDYPGIYPRNLHGKGYLIKPEPLPGVQLPNLEHPEDLLTPERLFVLDPARWYVQPLPWCFDWTDPVMFPRMAYLRLSPRFPAPLEADLPEIRAGFVSREQLARETANDEEDAEIPLDFYQEASLGMQFRQLEAGTPIQVAGMNAEHPNISFLLPQRPEIRVEMEGQVVNANIQLSQCVILPDRLQLQVTYAALVVDMPRVFIPGVHKPIPFRVTIDGDAPIDYEAPTPVLEKLENGGRNA